MSVGNYYGPAGGSGGAEHFMAQSDDKVKQVRIWSDGQYIHGVAFLSAHDLSLNPPVGRVFGRNNNAPLVATIDLADDEYITNINGQCGPYVNSLHIETTHITSGQKSEYPSATGRYGGSGGATPYYFSGTGVGPEKITALFGRTGDWIDAIGVFTAPLSMPPTPDSIPLSGAYDPSGNGNVIQYDDVVALASPLWNYILLSGGSSVRSNVTVVNADEMWLIGSRKAGIGPVSYGDEIILVMPRHGGILLSGGPAGVRTSTTTVGNDEVWQLAPVDYNRTNQPIRYGEFVTLTMPFYPGYVLLGGWPGVFSNLADSGANTESIWQFFKSQ